MADDKLPKSDKLSTFQKGAIGIFLSTFAVYEVVLKSDEVKQSLGIAYPWFLMALTIFGLSCAAMSGPQVFEVIDAVKKFLTKGGKE